MTDTARARRCDLVVFDVAGTTVFDGDAVVKCLIAALEPYVEATADSAREVMGLPKPVAIRELLTEAGVCVPADLDAIVAEVHEVFRAAMLTTYRSDPGLAPAPDAERVFAALRQAGVRVALDTGFSRDILDAVLNRLGWSVPSTLDVAISSDEVEQGRPFPDMIRLAMERTGVTKSSRVAKVGDTVSDLLEGLAAECGIVVGITHGTHTRAQLERDGVIVIDRLRELLPLVGVEE
jgi:phosphonatase-like hydrolase